MYLFRPSGGLLAVLRGKRGVAGERCGVGQCAEDVRAARIREAMVRHYTRETLPLYCESRAGAHRLVIEEDCGDFFCVTCGRFYPGGGGKRKPRRIRWNDGAVKQVRMPF